MELQNHKLKLASEKNKQLKDKDCLLRKKLSASNETKLKYQISKIELQGKVSRYVGYGIPILETYLTILDFMIPFRIFDIFHLPLKSFAVDFSNFAFNYYNYAYYYSSFGSSSLLLDHIYFHISPQVPFGNLLSVFCHIFHSSPFLPSPLSLISCPGAWATYHAPCP